MVDSMKLFWYIPHMVLLQAMILLFVQMSALALMKVSVDERHVFVATSTPWLICSFMVLLTVTTTYHDHVRIRNQPSSISNQLMRTMSILALLLQLFALYCGLMSTNRSVLALSVIITGFTMVVVTLEIFAYMLDTYITPALKSKPL